MEPTHIQFGGGSYRALYESAVKALTAAVVVIVFLLIAIIALLCRNLPCPNDVGYPASSGQVTSNKVVTFELVLHL